MFAALAEVCAESGASNATVTNIVERAGVSRRTFYELFSDSKACFLAGFDDGLARIAEVVTPACEQRGGWLERIRAGLLALLSFLEEHPATGRLVIVESVAAGREVLERRDRALARIVDAIDEGRAEAAGGLTPTRLTAEGVAGGALFVLHGRLLEGAGDSYLALLKPLMSMLVHPYLGPEAAQRELARATPSPRARPPQAEPNPLKDLPIRFTYRTMRVLTVVASESGGSNRSVGEHAGITDQGQISKLLSRLQRLGLIANAYASPGPGSPNAWVLTDRGREVHRALGG